MLRGTLVPEGTWRLAELEISEGLAVWPTPSGAPVAVKIVGRCGVCYNGPQHRGSQFSMQPAGRSGPVHLLC